MKRKEQLQQWLGDRRRTYADGLRLFRALASDAVKNRYSAYLEKGADGVSNPFDPRFTQLVNCLSKIAQAIRWYIMLSRLQRGEDNSMLPCGTYRDIRVRR